MKALMILIFCGATWGALTIALGFRMMSLGDKLARCTDAKACLAQALKRLGVLHLGQPACWHELKTWPEYFDSIVSLRKMFEVRINDRKFRVGDGLIVREWNPLLEKYTGRVEKRIITYVSDGIQGTCPDYVVLSLKLVDE